MSQPPEREVFQRRIKTFVEDISEVVEHRSRERAALRRSLGGDPSKIDEVHPIARRVVVPHIASDDWRPRERAFYTVASLIAAQPRKRQLDLKSDGDEAVPMGEVPPEQEETPVDTSRGEDGTPEREKRLRRNLGAALANAAVDRAKAAHGIRLDDDPKAVRSPEEDRLHLLCRQDNDGLHRFIPKVTRLLRARDRTPDWEVLTEDLAYWSGRGRDIVAKNWLDGFYRTLEARKRYELKKNDDTKQTTTPEEDNT
ncbi:type I-E CRISPR-associated protein Cse2/CasB [Spiractinospora alimapuensis]|uniref:type I-E CRISPR-associated protein Cse2/CasB n=1 Tax=Spiractinospora alimapuensis TaxID=2820884 RepID=UPI001F17C9BA|nr:type I-E CRISPR-associated protein Cse2/CasB [Spiractinospora alimapuensis]QVQ51553.1 type I-E CRISPR-associated protein Cse2/CasB [Spiractinospora alimapuensis]